MSRAVLMSAAGDPFIALFALKLFQERWYDEAQRFYIGYNNHSGVPQEVAREFLSAASKDPKVHIIYHPVGIGNGVPITEMLDVCKSENVMLMEDDGFVFTSGIVDECFKKIESGETDVVGSPRFSCGVEVGEASRIKYGLDYTGYGDVGPNFWPNFFFSSRKNLLSTDGNHASYTWKAGEHCPHLEHTFKEDNHGDTFVWTCVQLRAMGLRFHSVPQNHADPYEVESRAKGEMNWMTPMKWIHAGSLSAGWGGYLSGQTPDVSHTAAKLEMETRCAFWNICSEAIPGFDEFKERYQAGGLELIKNAELDIGRISKKTTIYKQLMHV